MHEYSRFARVLVSPFMAWIAILVVGTYFMCSFDKKVLQQPAQPGVMGTITQYYNAFKLSYLKKGIDLEGGTYLILGVDLDKAVSNRLGIEARSIEELAKKKGLKVLPLKKEVRDNALEMTFPDEISAKEGYHFIQDLGTALRLKIDETIVRISLAPETEQAIRSGAVEQAVKVLTNRLGGYGVEGIVVQQHGDHQIVVQLPGLGDSERVKQEILRTAHLEFKIVEKTSGSKEAVLDEFDGELPSDKMVIPGKRISESAVDENAGQWYLVPAFADLSGDRIKDASARFDEYNRPYIAMEFTSQGAREFGELTSNNVGRNLGIIIDDIMISDPVIQTPITGGKGSITGRFSLTEANDLAILLKSGSLQAPLTIEHENRVGASLGQDSINKGVMSCLIALLLLFFFSILYYKLPGFLAILTLFYNVFLTLLFLSYFGATLTLPGLAGIVLTIGMAIDISILVYERVKEELAAGTPLRKSVVDGFNGTLAVVLDSNISTFLTGVILFQFGGPAIKGFAVTLMAGIVATLLSGIFFLKSMYKFFFDLFDIKQMRF
jgi:preprotein translocase subunit SecD